MGSSLSVADRTKQSRRRIDRAIIEMDMEAIHFNREKRNIENEIRSMVKKNQMGAARIMAKDLANTNAYISNFYKMRSSLIRLKLGMQTINTTYQLKNAIGDVTRSMKRMNSTMRVGTIVRLMNDFEAETEKMNMKSEIIEDVMEDVVLGPDVDDESEEIIDQVFAELGLDLGGRLESAPTAPVMVGKELAETDEDKLLSRLTNLKGE